MIRLSKHLRPGDISLTLDAVRDAEHPYRKVWADFEGVLEVREVGTGLLY